MPVSLLDIVVLGVVVISAVLAMMRGFTREVLAIASWGTAAVVAYLLHPQVLPYVKPYIANDKIALPVAIGAVFLITLVLVSLITVEIVGFHSRFQNRRAGPYAGFHFRRSARCADLRDRLCVLQLAGAGGQAAGVGQDITLEALSGIVRHDADEHAAG